MIVPNSSVSSVEGGNTKTPSTKQISPAIRWCFTLNNYTELEVSSILSIFDMKAKMYILGDEIGEKCGTPHIQGYVEFKTKLRPLSLISTINRIHWEKSKGTTLQNIEYCSKMKVLASKGIPRPIEVIEKLYPWQKNIEDIYLGKIDKRRVYWFWDTKGNIGKSEFVKYMFVKYKICFCSSGKYADIINLIFNTNMDDVNAVIFDIPRANMGNVSYASIEAIKNGLICNTKYETGAKVFNSPHVFVFANCPPEYDKFSDDRWFILEL